MTDPMGIATIPAKSTKEPPAVRLDGDCLRKTMRRLDMSQSARDALTAQAGELTGRVIEVYTDEYGPGEVGDGGSARAGTSKAASEFGCTGLLYGRIQSGKTAAMITTTALAIDNGFRVIVLLTTNFVKLVQQTKDRFNDLEKALVHASTEADAWRDDLKNIAKHTATRGLVVICAKHAGHMESVCELLEKISAPDYPALILDDEADQASLDANVRRRATADKPDDIAPTKIAEQIQRLRGLLRHHVFLQVTATPFALLLQNVDAPARPRFAFLLEPGEGYCGGEHFFADDIIGDDEALAPEPPLYFVGEDESKEIEKGPTFAPSGLEKAISYFLVAAAAQALADSDSYKQSQNFLCHTSHKNLEHTKLSDLISAFVSSFEDELGSGTGKAKQLVEWAHEELKRTHQPPPLEQIVEDILDRLPRRKIRIVNSEGKTSEEVRGAPNFIVGGNIVGRGLTIPNLLVTYYLRRPQVSQMDTMLQHARMFGYRAKLMPYTRVFLPRSLAVRFNRIHAAEADLRRMIPTIDVLQAIPVEVVGKLKPTRYGVLDPGQINSIRTGQHLYPSVPDYNAPATRRKEIERILSLIFKIPNPSTAVPSGKRTSVAVSMDQLIELVQAFEVYDDEWDNRGVPKVLRQLGEQGATGTVAWRKMTRAGNSEALSTGAVSQDELVWARSNPGPTFFIFRQTEPRPVWKNQPFWYPSLVFPSGMPSKVYNRTSDGE